MSKPARSHSESSIQDLIQRMDDLLARWDASRDYRAVFIRSYREITARMAQGVSGAEFEDVTWMQALDITFGQLYFDALDGFDAGVTAIPKCWKIAFDLARAKKTTVLQDLLLGMNAHINHDLPIAVYRNSLDASQRLEHQRDYDKVNLILAGMIDSVQKAVTSHYSVILAYFDRWFGRSDEFLAEAGIRFSRNRAWAHAVALADSRHDQERQELLKRLDDEVSLQALAIAAPAVGWSKIIQPIRDW